MIHLAVISILFLGVPNPPDDSAKVIMEKKWTGNTTKVALWFFFISDTHTLMKTLPRVGSPA